MRSSLLVTPALAVAVYGTGVCGQTRTFQPADLFRLERVGRIVWTPDGNRAAVMIARPGRWLGQSVPTSEIDLVDARSGRMQRLATPSLPILGYFGAAWSPDGGTLAFLSVDTNAIVRPWIWRVGGRPPAMLRGVQLPDGIADPPTINWTDERHVVVMARDSARAVSGPLYVAIRRDQNAADQWRRAREGRIAAVIVTDSRDPSGAASPASRIVAIDVTTGSMSTLAGGPLHHLELSSDRRTIAYRSENPPLAIAPASSYLATTGAPDDAYLKVDWGGEIHHVDSRTGAPAPAPHAAPAVARDSAAPALRAVSDPADGTRLVLIRRGKSDTTLWRGNGWAKEVRPGRAQPIAYTSTDGRPLTGWILFPPDYTPGRRLPVVVGGYPSTTYGPRLPAEFSILDDYFEHPQLFAALGYAFVLASMPVADERHQASAWDEATQGILPLLDTVIARGIADSNRIAFIGQSAGGYAALALAAQTNRFRSIIASGVATDLPSEYGSFYGEYRYGDAGSPLRAQLLRMLQFERGAVGAAGPPWDDPAWYARTSPISHVAAIRAPVLLVKGEADFIPVQQAEELFTALYRQDKRVRLVRYFGEGHTITARANVLDLWKQFDVWLRETMTP